MKVEDLVEEQHVSCVYITATTWGCVNGVVKKVMPKTFIVETTAREINIKKKNVITLKYFKEAV